MLKSDISVAVNHAILTQFQRDRGLLRAAVASSLENPILCKLEIPGAEGVEQPGIRNMEGVALDPDMTVTGKGDTGLGQLRGNADDALATLVVVLKAGIFKHIIPDGDFLTAAGFIPGANVPGNTYGSSRGGKDIILYENLFRCCHQQTSGPAGPKGIVSAD